MAVGQGSKFPLRIVDGIRIGVASAGVRKPGRKDLVLFEIAEGSTLAASFTTNAFCAAPVTLARRHMGDGKGARYLLINTGNANAGTGEPGMRAAMQCCEALASHAGCAVEQVLPFSTGVIGELLPADRVVAGLPAVIADLAPDHWESAANGIMTTDTRPKGASRQIEVHGKTVTISGIAKGAGMIKPNMATMLGFVATDAAVEPDRLQSMLGEAVLHSFNSITVDGDTSTNDACVVVATGASGAHIDDNSASAFAAALREVCEELAQAIVRDGEGATKFVTVAVGGARDRDEARRVGYAVAESPLVKTALFASDPNWGRILAAVGRAGVEDLVVDGVTVTLNNTVIARNGAVDPSYTEQAGQAAMGAEEITIEIGLGRGASSATIWTTDLSYDYVKINADYRS